MYEMRKDVFRYIHIYIYICPVRVNPVKQIPISKSSPLNLATPVETPAVIR